MKKRITVKGVESSTSGMGMGTHMSGYVVAGMGNGIGSSGGEREPATKVGSSERAEEKWKAVQKQQQPEWVQTMRDGLPSGEWEYDLGDEDGGEVEGDQRERGRARERDGGRARGSAWTGLPGQYVEDAEDALLAGPTLGPYAFSGAESGEMDKVGGSWL